MDPLTDQLIGQELVAIQNSIPGSVLQPSQVATATAGAILAIFSATLVVGGRSGGTQTLELPQDLQTSATPSFAGLILGGGTNVKKISAVSGALDFPNTAAQSSADLTLAVTGCKVGDFVIPSMPAPPANSCWECIGILANGLVTFRFNNYSAAPIDPASATFAVLWFSII